MIKFSVLIVSYNNINLLKDCLQSLYKVATDEVEIIIVDNNSDKDVVDYLESQEKIILIKNKSNIGFGKANNQAAEIAKGRWLTLLNNDAKVREDIFRKAEGFFSSHPGYQIMGPLVLSPDGFPQPTFYNNDYYRQLVLPSYRFRKYIKTLSFGTDTAVKKQLLYKYSSEYSFVNTHEVESLSGVCMFIERKVIKDIGLFDENYFMYVEDLDFCFKARKNNYRIAFFPEIMITHYIKSIQHKTSVSWTGFNNSLKYFYKKNFPWYKNYPARVILLFKAFLKYMTNKNNN